MKRIALFLTCFCLFASFVLAGPVDTQRALQIAKEFVPRSSVAKKAPKKGEATTTSNIVYAHKMPKSGRDAFYIVNVGDAFVLVSADDVAHQILGYSFDKCFPVDADGTVQLPPHVIGFFDDLAAQMEAAIEAEPNRAADDDWTGAQKAARRTPSNLPESVGPLLTTTWDQGQYYNALCPEDANGPDGHVWTGCAATAMAQIIKYWNEPVHGRGIHSYDSNYGTLEVNFAESNYDFNNMPDALTSESTAEQINAVAKLIYDCGVAANMFYSSGESEAFNEEIRTGLINFFCFSPDLSFAEKAYFSNVEWNNLLRQNLAASHPVYYSGKGTGGHAFVCDGYKADDFYHFNFGWGGFADGWFLTSAVTPNDQEFNSSQSAIVNIVSDNIGNVILGQMQGSSTFLVDEPLEFYHLMGHNKYKGSNYDNPCNNTVTFISVDDSKQIVADIMEFEDQNVQLFDGTNTDNALCSLYGGGDNDMSPAVSTANAMTVSYSGNMYYAGFKLKISLNDGFRMVSNITSSIDATTVHLIWTENGTASQWQIEYGLKDFELGKGVVYNVTTNTATFEDLKKFTEYDFYIRSVYENNQYGPWNKVTIMIEAPYWQDVVTSQPESYVVDDSNGNAIISCAEDFIWYLKRHTGYYNAIFISDIDMGGYKFKPQYQVCSIDGNGHIINNLYINEKGGDAALFSSLFGSISNLGIENAYISGSGGRTGGLSTQLSEKCSITNCYINNSVIHGYYMVGGLVSANYGTIQNCYANVNVICDSEWAGLLTANSQGTISNCYAIGDLKIKNPCDYAGITGYGGGLIKNCYSIDLPTGVIDYAGDAIIADTSTIYNEDHNWKLRLPVTVDDEKVSNLIDALNKWVFQMNDSTIRTWHIIDGFDFPQLGTNYVVVCPNVDRLTVTNSIINDENCIVLDWEETGDATKWEIKYKTSNTQDNKCTIIPVTSKPYVLYNLSMGKEYIFSVRSINDDNNHSGWVSQNEMVDFPYWTDVVTTCPSGYVEDTDGNVTISTAEGLAWLSVVVNGLHDQPCRSFNNKTIKLSDDINLQGYRWYPIGRDNETAFSGIFDGNGFRISNLYINIYGPNVGLFGYAREASFCNVTIGSGQVSSYAGDRYYVGALVGNANRLTTISNCHSNASVSAIEWVGALCGCVFDDREEGTLIYNCSSSGDVRGQESCGGFFGEACGVIIQNCYSTGNVLLQGGNVVETFRGGFIGALVSNAIVMNCYSTGNVEVKNMSYICGRVIGQRLYNTQVQYVYGPFDDDLPIASFSPTYDLISDVSSFNNKNGIQNLNDQIAIDGNTYSNLLDALNAWVKKMNNPLFRQWGIDVSNNGGYPVLGDYFVPSCYNPIDVHIKNTTEIGDQTIRTRIAWKQEGDASSWDILYVDAQQSIDNGTIIPVTSNPCDLTDLPVGKWLDIYIRAKKENGEMSGWSKYVRYIPDKLRWTEVVTSQPDGYLCDDDGNVYISSAEGLAWLASVMNGLNGNQTSTNIKKVFLQDDIDLGLYRWTAINSEDMMGLFTFEGNSHTIKGLYCNEYANYQGLFGKLHGTIQNLYIVDSSIHGLLLNGIIAGYASSRINNCLVSGEVHGLAETGGMCGEVYGDINNSAFRGSVVVHTDITLPNTLNGYSGGLVGGGGCTIENSYLVAEITESSYSGIITSAGGFPAGTIINSYYKTSSTNLPITGTGNTYNISSFTEDGNHWTLSTPPYINGVFCPDLFEALNAWVDANNTEGQYRHWVADMYNANGGFPIFAPAYLLTYKVDDEIYKTKLLEVGAELPMVVEPTKEGHTFSGWGDLPKVMPAHDVTIKATYSYTIRYLLDGREYKSMNVNYGTELKVEDAPEKEGYTFSGWSEIPETMPARDVTIFGSFTVNKYLMTYIVDGEAYKTDSIAYGTKVTAEAKPAKEGYTFSGWSEIPDTMPARDVAVAGAFTINSYKLTYLLNGEVYKSDSIIYATPLSAEPAIEREGYTFSGWSEVPTTMPARDVTVTATLKVNTYTITYFVDGSEYKTTRVDFGTALTAEDAPEKEGYSFSGWSVIPEDMPAHDVTITGTFTVNKYKVQYYVGEQLWAEDEVEYGSKVTLRNYAPEDANRYSFAGWDGEKFETMPAYDIEYHAMLVDGVSRLNADTNGIEAIYDGTGRKLSKMQRGVNVLRMKDGTTRKVFR